MDGDGEADEPLYQRCRRVVGAGAVTLFRVHEALEHSTEHVGRHHAAITLPGGEVECLEQRVKRIAPRRRRDVHLPPPLEEVWLEKSTVEKGDPAEPPGNRPSLCQRPVQRAEEERPQEVAMQRATPAEAVVDGPCDEVVAAIEPPFALHEVEKEDPSELQEGKRAVVGRCRALRHRLPKPLEGVPELAEEPRAEGLNGKQVSEARGCLERREVAQCRDPFECRDGRGVGLVERHLEHRRPIYRDGEHQPTPCNVEAGNRGGPSEGGTRPCHRPRCRPSIPRRERYPGQRVMGIEGGHPQHLSGGSGRKPLGVKGMPLAPYLERREEAPESGPAGGLREEGVDRHGVPVGDQPWGLGPAERHPRTAGLINRSRTPRSVPGAEG